MVWSSHTIEWLSKQPKSAESSITIPFIRTLKQLTRKKQKTHQIVQEIIEKKEQPNIGYQIDTAWLREKPGKQKEVMNVVCNFFPTINIILKVQKQEYFIKNTCYSVVKSYLCKQNSKRSLFNCYTKHLARFQIVIYFVALIR